MKKQLWMLLNVCAVTLAFGQRFTPQQLEAARAGGDKLTLIDLRSQSFYAKGTLPDALHMGVREALEKKHSGLVVFFDDGLNVNRARRAVDAFEKAGKKAAELVGGYAAWHAAGLATTERKGLSGRSEPYVTYQQLTGDLVGDAADVVLVDVRETEPAPSGRALQSAFSGETAEPAGSAATNAPAAPLNLAAEFPAFRVTRQPLASGSQRGVLGAAEAGAAQPLYVLIDSGDGKAGKKAAELRASGCSRVVVLAGGEPIIRRKGEPGLVRRGPGTGLITDKDPSQKNMATINQEVTP